MATTTATALPLREAAARMGMTTDTLRKRLQRGLTPGQKVDGQWFVVPDGAPDVSVSVQDAAGPGPDQTGQVHSPPPAPDVPQEGPGGALLGDRAAEMARYSRELLAPVLARLEAQATEIGRLEERTATLRAENEHLRAQLAAAPAATASTNGVAHHDAHDQAAAPAWPAKAPETASAPPGGGGAPWWRRWLFG